MRKIGLTSRILVLVAAVAMVSAYFYPIWQIKLWAPQYPEGIGMQIWIDRLTGDLASINKMNFYIGMAEIDEAMFPEFDYLKYIIGFIMAVGIVAGIAGRRMLMNIFLGLLVLLGIGALVDMYLWGYDYGHNLDPTAAIKIPGQSYQPPLIGYEQLLNFLAYSGPDTAGWILSGSALLVFVAILIEYGVFRRLFKRKKS